MTLWLALSFLSVAAAILMLVPFLGRQGARVVAADHLISISREQLQELENDVKRGLIGEQEAHLARVEIERRVLTAARQGELNLSGSSNKMRLASVAIVVGWVVVGSAILYSFIGQPDIRSSQFARAGVSEPLAVNNSNGVASEQAVAGNVGTMISDLAARLSENPEDAEGWRMLGWSHFNTGDYGSSVDAYAKAVALDPGDPVIYSVFGEAIVRSEGGQVSNRALSVFHQALALDPTDPRAKFFQGMALEQRDDPAGAISLWLEVLGAAPSDADWGPGLRERILELASATGFDLASRPEWTDQSVPPSVRAPSGPSAADVLAAQSMSTEDRQLMIRGMVDGLAGRLAENPNDSQGWILLIRSYTKLSDGTAAKAALEKARNVLGQGSEEFDTIVRAAADLGVE